MKSHIVRMLKSLFNRENLEVIVTAVILALIIRAFVVQAFRIPTGSMRPTLIEGDRILVNKFIYRFTKPQRGDIIVFKYPEDKKKDFIKRLIGLEGESIQIKEMHIWVDGKQIFEPGILGRVRYYNNKDEIYGLDSIVYGREGEVVKVPKESYFVLGDNSVSSRDSRYWGFVPKKYLVGKAMVIYWPLTRIRVLK